MAKLKANYIWFDQSSNPDQDSTFEFFFDGTGFSHVVDLEELRKKIKELTGENKNKKIGIIVSAKLLKEIS